MSDEHDPEFLRRLQEAFAKLPRRQREIFLAHRVGAMSYEEIARRTGLSVRQVERHIARVLCKLDRQLCGERLRWWERLF